MSKCWLPHDQILDLWVEGKTGAEIARLLGIGHALTVNSIVRRARLKGDARATKRPSGGKIRRDHQAILALRERGLSYREISERLGIGKNTPMKACHRAQRLAEAAQC